MFHFLAQLLGREAVPANRYRVSEFWKVVQAEFEEFGEPRGRDRLSESAWQRLQIPLRRIHRSLRLERDPDDSHALVITAGGDPAGFSAVRAVVAAAPELHGWHVIGFRQRRRPIPAVTQGDVTLRPQEVRFHAEELRSRRGVTIYLPEFPKEFSARLTYIEPAFELLMAAVGEVDLIDRLGSLRWEPTPQPIDPQLHPTLLELPAHLDACWAESPATGHGGEIPA